MVLSSRRLVSPLTNNAPELVFIHGWGMSSIVWQQWLSVIRPHCNVTMIDLPGFGFSEPSTTVDLDILVNAIVEKAPKKAIYLGYSLGGMLAVKVANKFPERVSALITFASNVRFVANESWPYAMESDVFESFYTTTKAHSEKAIKRFAGLQVSGASNEKKLLKRIRAKQEDNNKQALIDTLTLLSEIDNTEAIQGLSLPTLFVFAENDQLVPVLAAQKMQEQHSENIVILDDAPHCFFISHPQKSWDVVSAFLKKNNLASNEESSYKRVLDKQQVARSFSRAASSYDSVADLQRRVGETLLSYLPTHAADVVLDLGCGTGYFTRHLCGAYPSSAVVGLDLAQGMVAHASKHHNADAWLCADAESLPFADNSVDVIFSSLAIQWCENSPSLFAEIFRVLKPSGSFVFSTLGPNTLHELRSAWSKVDDYVHVNRFVGDEVLSVSANAAGFELLDHCLGLSEETIELEYDSLRQLTRELKSLGAHNVNSGRPSGLTGKKSLRQLTEAYEQQRNSNGMLPASYQAWYGVLQKPACSNDTSDVIAPPTREPLRELSREK